MSQDAYQKGSYDIFVLDPEQEEPLRDGKAGISDQHKPAQASTSQHLLDSGTYDMNLAQLRSRTD